MQASLTAPRLGALGATLGRGLHYLRRMLGQHRYDELALEQVAGLPIVVIPGVFNPRALRTGEFFASQIANELLPCDADVLDMGTGSGICAVAAARQGRRVVAVDINPAAVRCTRINALLSHVEHSVDVRQGDLFAPLRGERFDLMLFNPPFLCGTPADGRDCAWRSPDAAERFVAEARGYLKPGGRALVLLSTFGDAPEFVRYFDQYQWSVTVVAERRFINETLAIFRLTDAHS